ETHWDGIIGDLQRMMFGYETMKLLDQVVEDEAERSYYNLLKSTLEALAAVDAPLVAVQMWFYLRLLSLTGHAPNLKTDQAGKQLEEGELYAFLPDDMCFSVDPYGVFRAEHIKLLRLSLSHQPAFLKQIQNA